jgi:CRP-like cAMP-binding protein
MDTPADNTQSPTPKPMGPWVLQATALSDCPLHRNGDRLLVRPPAIHHAGPGCCLVPFLKLRSLLREGIEGDIACSWGPCSGTWKAVREIYEDAPGWDPAALESDLEGQPFLLQLPQAVAVALVNAGSRHDFPAGQIVLESGQINSELYVVVKGALEVMEGDLRISTIQRGECFGELSILVRQPVSNTVRCATPCTLIAITRDRFHELLSRYGSLGTLLNRLLARRLRASNRQLENILRPGIWGNLEVFPFLSVVQSIQAGSMTGLLTITRPRGRAVFGFDKGRLCYGQVGERSGEEALLEIFRWNSGIFRFQDKEPHLEQNIHGETMAVLLEALRKFDELQLQESTSAASTRLEPNDGSLTDTHWAPQTEVDETRGTTTVPFDPDGTSEFDIGELGIRPPPRS